MQIKKKSPAITGRMKAWSPKNKKKSLFSKVVGGIGSGVSSIKNVVKRSASRVMTKQEAERIGGKVKKVVTSPAAKKTGRVISTVLKDYGERQSRMWGVKPTGKKKRKGII